MLWRMFVYLVLICAAGGLAVLAHHITPPQHNPFRPLDLADPPGAATYAKITGLADDADACQALLSAANIGFTPLDDSAQGADCGFRNAVTLDRSLAPYSATLQMTCPLTAALVIWERHVAAPAAMEHLGAKIVRFETMGAYNCRRIGGGTRGRWSEHATANAVDIAGVHLDDGRMISVLSDWSEDTPEAAFLRDLRDGACRLFSVVLSPDYNRAHADHFHFDMGPANRCS